MKLIGKLLAVDIFAPNIVFQLFFVFADTGGVGTYKSVRERDLAHD